MNRLLLGLLIACHLPIFGETHRIELKKELHPGDTLEITYTPPVELPAPEPKPEPKPEPAPTPQPPADPNVVHIGPSYPARELDDVNLDARPNVTYLLERGCWVNINNPQKIAKAGITIRSADGPGDPATIYFAGGAHARAFQVTGENFTIRDVRIVGHNKAALIKAENVRNPTIAGVHQIKGKDGQGISLAEIIGSEKPVIDSCSTEYTGWNALYFSGKSPNVGAIVTNNRFGPSKDEHCFRAYGLYDAYIGNNVFDNGDHAVKQAYKLMSGDKIQFVANVVIGSVRHGRDVNDPPDQTLTNLVISACEYRKCTWWRVDDGAKLSLRNSTLDMERSTAISVAGSGRLYIEHTTINGAKSLADNPGKVTVGPGVTLKK